MATATPSPTPNPDAMKYTLDVTLPESFNASSGEGAGPFVAALFAAGGVASVFGINDFVTVTRVPGADWESITAAVVAAAAEHL